MDKVTMITLKENQLVGSGSERSCYRHPQNHNLCIKVTRNNTSKKNQNLKDSQYFKYLEHRHVNWSHLPRCYGWTKTNLGSGLVFDLIQDNKGNPLKSLRYLLEKKEIKRSDIEPSLEQIYRYLLDNLIFTSDLRDSNIVCDKSQSPHPYLYIIDGIGDRDFIKLAAHFAPLGRRKIERQWRHFMKRMEKWD